MGMVLRSRALTRTANGGGMTMRLMMILLTLLLPTPVMAWEAKPIAELQLMTLGELENEARFACCCYETTTRWITSGALRAEERLAKKLAQSIATPEYVNKELQASLKRIREEHEMNIEGFKEERLDYISTVGRVARSKNDGVYPPWIKKVKKSAGLSAEACGYKKKGPPS